MRSQQERTGPLILVHLHRRPNPGQSSPAAGATSDSSSPGCLNPTFGRLYLGGSGHSARPEQLLWPWAWASHSSLGRIDGLDDDPPPPSAGKGVWWQCLRQETRYGRLPGSEALQPDPPLQQCCRGPAVREGSWFGAFLSFMVNCVGFPRFFSSLLRTKSRSSWVSVRWVHRRSACDAQSF